MRVTISQPWIEAHQDHVGDVWDEKLPGLVLRMRPTGAHAYLVSLGRRRMLTLGRADVLTPTAARKLAQTKLGDQAHGLDPIAERKRKHAATLEQFLDKHFSPWAVQQRAQGAAISQRVRSAFPGLLRRPLADIAPFALEKWRAAKHAAGVKPATTNRDLNAIGSVLSRAVTWGFLRENPARKVERAKVDTLGRVRALSPDEARRLRTALAERDQRLSAARDRANRWRQARGYPLWPARGVYADHVTPCVLLLMATGMRRGSLLHLRWADVDLAARRVTIRGASAKGGRTYYVPLSDEAVDVLTRWGPKAADCLVFPGPDDGRAMTTLKTAWGRVTKAAGLHGVRMHDLRHDFASRLAGAGVDLFTIQQLLGHKDARMVQRYAHLTSDHLAAAIAKASQAR